MGKKKILIWNPLRSDGFQTFLSSVLCVLGGFLIGYLVLLAIEPSGAWDAIVGIVKNHLIYPKTLQPRYLGQTIVRSVPLLMCALSVLFAYKVGMFNIGAAGQYVVGACAALYGALQLGLPWYVCLLAAMLVGGLWGVLAGVLKTLCNVNVVISGIMLNWIGLYLTNMVLVTVKNPTSPYTKAIKGVNPDALLPAMGLDALFGGRKSFITIAVPLALVVTVLIWIVLDRTKFGYELKATGHNYHAAKYCGMKENRNIILTMLISGALAGLGAGLLYLTGLEEWETTVSSVPGMGFNGIAVAFLGGLNPVGSAIAAFFIQHITSGGANVDTAHYSPQISGLISSLIIYLCAFAAFFKFFIHSAISKADERRAKNKQPAPAEEGGDWQ